MSDTLSSPNSAQVPAKTTYLRLLEHVRPYKVRLTAGFLFGVLYALANGALVWVIKGGIRETFVEPTPSKSGMLFVLTVVFFPVVGVVRGLSDYLSRYYMRWVGNRVVMDLRNEMFRHLHGLSIDYFTDRRTGELIARNTDDTRMIETSVSDVITDLAKQPITLLAMVVWIFLVDVKLALVSLIVFPICVLPITAFGRKVRNYSRQAQERIADVVSILQETVSGVRIVKAFGMEEYETSRFVAQTGAFFSRMKRVVKADASIEPIITFIATAGLALVLVYVHGVHMEVDNFFAFAAALFMMYEPVKKISRLHIRIQQSCASADRIFEVLDTKATVRDRPEAGEFHETVKEIRFADVAFSYDAEPVLRDVSFCVSAGERVAFVGSSGAGKTTLVNLLPRFYDVTSGSISLNGVDLRDIKLRSLRSLLGLVTQETFLFNDTVANNISYGFSGASRKAIEEAAQRAYAHEFITKTPEGYDTMIGERGVRLSGGQRQRLAIARAILRNPPILILDEATSALDTESERMVQAAIDDLMTGRTVFAIAHRLSTITSCDRIIVLDKGRIVEQGTHEELVALGGNYKRLYDMQFET
jgi:ATP-binding cassette, subfamily B, bacterial MsbA